MNSPLPFSAQMVPLPESFPDFGQALPGMSVCYKRTRGILTVSYESFFPIRGKLQEGQKSSLSSWDIQWLVNILKQVNETSSAVA